MSPNVSSRRTLAFTLVEMLTVIAIIGILAALLLPALSKSEARAKLVFCIHSQQQIGLAFHAFSNDHNGKFPMAISTNDGGSLEYVQIGFNASGPFYTSFRNFQALSNELVLPQTLICPADTTRTATNNFALLQNQNLSYSVGVQSTFDKPISILAGDRNIGGEIYPQMTIAYADHWKPHSVWNWEIHQSKGNMLFADGHVEEWNNDNSYFTTVNNALTPVDILFLPSIVQTLLPTASGSPGSSGPGPAPGSGGPDSADSSGQSSSQPNVPSTGQWESSPAGNPGMQSPAPNGSSPAGRPMPPVSASYGERFYETETLAQAQAPEQTGIAKTATSEAETNVMVSVKDPNAGMSPFDRHMTMVMQNSILWFYILLCILVLLYLLNKLRKKLVKKRDEQDRESGTL